MVTHGFAGQKTNFPQFPRDGGWEIETWLQMTRAKKKLCKSMEIILISVI